MSPTYREYWNFEEEQVSLFYTSYILCHPRFSGMCIIVQKAIHIRFHSNLEMFVTL